MAYSAADTLKYGQYRDRVILKFILTVWVSQVSRLRPGILRIHASLS